MTKYARPVSVASQIRLYDVIDTGDFSPSPSWGQTDADLLDRIFSPNKVAWVAAGQWFVSVLEGVQDGCIHTGSDWSDPASYINPDGTNGMGVTPP